MKWKKVYKNDARPRINPLAYLSKDGKKKKLYRFGTRLSYLSRWSMMKWKKVYKNDARPRINPLAYCNDGKKKKFTSLELGYLTCPHGQR
jgi:hypothetical protein